MNKKTEYFIPGIEDKIKEIKEHDRLEELNITAETVDIDSSKITETVENTEAIVSGNEKATIPTEETIDHNTETIVLPTDTEPTSPSSSEALLVNEHISDSPAVIGEAISVFSTAEDKESIKTSETISAQDLEMDGVPSLNTSNNQQQPAAPTNEKIQTTTSPKQETPEPISIPSASNQQAQIPQKKKSHFLVGLLSLLALLIAGGGLTSYFVFFQKTEINPFDYISLSTEGVSGNAKAMITINEDALMEANIDDLTRFTDFLSDLTVDVSKDNEITNGDTISLSIDANDPAFAEYRFKSTQLSKDFKIDGLSTVPATWDAVTNKSAIDAQVAEQLQSAVELYRTELNTIAQRDLGSTIDITINTNLQTTSYMSDLASCEDTKTLLLPQMQCGTVAFVYKIDFVIPSNYQFTGDSTIYQTFFVTNIFEKNGEMNFSPYSNLLSAVYTGNNLDRIISALTEKGFTQA